MLLGNARDNVVYEKSATPPRADDSAHCWFMFMKEELKKVWEIGRYYRMLDIKGV